MDAFFDGGRMEISMTTSKKREHVCIILAAYNGEAYIAEQIESIFHNTWKDFTLHIYDDCSTDTTPDIIKSFEEKYAGQVICHKNRKSKGVIQNFLQAAWELEADYYMLCDQDDVWLEGKIEKSLQYIKGLEDAAGKLPVIIFGDARVVDENLEIKAESFQRQSKFHSENTDLPHLLMENKLLGCTILFNHALKEKLELFPPQIRVHDWWLGLVGTAFGTVGFLDEPLLLYRQHGKNIIGNTSQKNYIKNRISHLAKQQDTIYRTCSQAEAFLDIYRDELSKEQREVIHAFATIPEQNWFIRRYRVLKYGFFKSGLIRNIGVFWVI